MFKNCQQIIRRTYTDSGRLNGHFLLALHRGYPVNEHTC